MEFPRRGASSETCVSEGAKRVLCCGVMFSEAANGATHFLCGWLVPLRSTTQKTTPFCCFCLIVTERLLS